MPLFEHGAGLRDGFISGWEKVEVIQKAAVMLCPYQIDAGPHVPLEAQACGTPVLAFRKAAMPEYVFGGFLADSVQEMAGLVPMAMSLDPGDIRRGIVDAGFCVERQVREIETLLRKVLAGERW